MYFWVKVRDSKFHSPSVAWSNRASLRCSIDPLPDRHQGGVRIAQAQAAGRGRRLAAKSCIEPRLLLGGNLRRNPKGCGTHASTGPGKGKRNRGLDGTVGARFTRFVHGYSVLSRVCTLKAPPFRYAR